MVVNWGAAVDTRAPQSTTTSAMIVFAAAVVPDSEPAVNDTELHVGITGRPSRRKRDPGDGVL